LNCVTVCDPVTRSLEIEAGVEEVDDSLELPELDPELVLFPEGVAERVVVTEEPRLSVVTVMMGEGELEPEPEAEFEPEEEGGEVREPLALPD